MAFGLSANGRMDGGSRGFADAYASSIASSGTCKGYVEQPFGILALVKSKPAARFKTLNMRKEIIDFVFFVFFLLIFPSPFMFQQTGGCLYDLWMPDEDMPRVDTVQDKASVVFNSTSTHISAAFSRKLSKNGENGTGFFITPFSLPFALWPPRDQQPDPGL